MVKVRETKSEPQIGAFSRMNYLYQAAQLLADISSHSPVVNHYNKVMKEISKKVVEKLHPDLKRTICLACNYSLTAEKTQINVKVKTFKRKKKNKKKKSQKTISEMPDKKEEGNEKSRIYKKSYKDRIKARNKRANKVKWCCTKCGFSKSFLQRPSYELWIHKEKCLNID